MNVSNDDWPIVDQHWSEEIPKPQRTQFLQSSMTKNTFICNAGINAEIHAVTTRAQLNLQAQPCSSSTHTSSPSTTTHLRVLLNRQLSNYMILVYHVCVLNERTM